MTPNELGVVAHIAIRQTSCRPRVLASGFWCLSVAPWVRGSRRKRTAGPSGFLVPQAVVTPSDRQVPVPASQIPSCGGASLLLGSGGANASSGAKDLLLGCCDPTELAGRGSGRCRSSLFAAESFLST